MSSLLDTIRGQLGQNEIAQISQRIGVDPATAQQAIDATLPIVVAGMAQHASTPDGAEQVAQAATNQSGLLGGLASAIGGAEGGGGLLSAILGRHTAAVQSGAQQASGLDGAKAQQLIALLSPIVLAALARHHADSAPASAPPSADGIGSVLRQAATHAAGSASPELGGILGKMFGI